MRLNWLNMILLSLISLPGIGQQENKIIREGNKHFEEADYEKAAELYLDAISKNPKSLIAPFNLGTALYKQEKYSEAAGQFESVISAAKEDDIKAKSYHNLGNSLLMQDQFEKSIEAYKNALRIDPTREDSRYNLAYAMKKLEERQKQQQQQQQDQQQQDKQEQQENEEEQEQQQQEQPAGLTKEQAERLLEAMQNREKEIQEKLNKEKTGSPVPIEKDW